MGYIENSERIMSLLSLIRKEYNINNESFGDYEPTVVYIIDFKNNSDDQIKLIKEFYEVNNKDFFKDVYLTSYNKTNNKEINDKILKVELNTLRASRVVNISDFHIKGPGVFNLSPSHYSNVLNKKFKDVKLDEENYEEARNETLRAMKFGIIGSV